jgi:hypothetical protein
MKARQSAKIRELGQALIDAGLRQADALGLRRSTAWTILKTRHKSTGLSAAIIERMLGSSAPATRTRDHCGIRRGKIVWSVWGKQATATAICRSPAQHHRKLVGLALYPIIRQMERAGALVHDDSHPTVAEDLVIPLGRQIEAPADIQNR